MFLFKMTLAVVCVTAAFPPQAWSQETGTWHLMQDGVVYALFNHQGSERGGEEVKVPNWWMGMASRKIGASQLTFNGMLSLDAAGGKKGYREIFQSGEVVDDRPLIDHQHPHDFFMQLAAVWRTPIGQKAGFTLAGGPSGEPALGPVAFMHRASSAENPFAPLSHHVFDSTHIAFGVVTAAVDSGPFLIEGSVFNGREPDEDRWDFDFGKLDSVSGRVWYRPGAEWEFQISSGHLKEPEALEHGNIIRTTASASWFKQSGANFTAVTLAYGQNDKEHGTQHSVLAEANHRFGPNSVFSRAELHQVETATLLAGDPEGGVTPPVSCPSAVHCLEGIDAGQFDRVLAFTIGGVREVMKWRGFEGAVGTAFTFYGVPEVLKPSYSDHPVSFQVFFRLRPPAPMGRMWGMRMSQPMPRNSSVVDPHAGHQMD